MGRRDRGGFRLRLEALEGRALLSMLTVTNYYDYGTGSLRAEVGLATAGDTIVFAPALVGRTISLTSGPIDIGSGIDIEGPGAQSLSVSGTGTLFNGFADETTPATMAGLTITGGSTSVVNFGGLTLRDDALRGNHGAFQNNFGATATVIHSVFADNHVGSATDGLAFGGAILNQGTLSISKSRLGQLGRGLRRARRGDQQLVLQHPEHRRQHVRRQPGRRRDDAGRRDQSRPGRDRHDRRLDVH